MYKAIILLLFVVISVKVTAQSSCTPDSTVFPKGTSFGIHPDSLTADANVGYNQTVQFKFPKDTTYSNFPVIIDSVRIDSVSHFPKSFSYQCGAKNCMYKGGSFGCATIMGSPVNGDVGSHNLMIHFTVYMHSTLIPSEIPLPDSGALKLTVNAHSGIFDQAINHKIVLNQNYPNPFSSETDIILNTNTDQNAGFTVRNELGQIVYFKEFQCKNGAIYIHFNRNGLPQGIYFYSIQTGNNIITRRMVIKD